LGGSSPGIPNQFDFGMSILLGIGRISFTTDCTDLNGLALRDFEVLNRVIGCKALIGSTVEHESALR
jgi:hypothetical protein